MEYNLMLIFPRLSCVFHIPVVRYVKHGKYTLFLFFYVYYIPSFC